MRAKVSSWLDSGLIGSGVLIGHLCGFDSITTSYRSHGSRARLLGLDGDGSPRLLHLILAYRSSYQGGADLADVEALRVKLSVVSV